MRYLSAIWTLVKKDIRSENRTKSLLFSTVSFGGMMIVLLGIALDGSPSLPKNWFSGLLWLIILIPSIFSFNLLGAKDQWDLGIWGSLMAPVDPSAIFYARLISNLVFVYFVELLMIPLFFIVFQQGIPIHLGWFLFTVFIRIFLTL